MVEAPVAQLLAEAGNYAPKGSLWPVQGPGASSGRNHREEIRKENGGVRTRVADIQGTPPGVSLICRFPEEMSGCPLTRREGEGCVCSFRSGTRHCWKSFPPYLPHLAETEGLTGDGVCLGEVAFPQGK